MLFYEMQNLQKIQKTRGGKMKNIIKNRIYMTSLLADMVSNFGDILYYLALMTYILALKDMRLALSIVNLSEILPIFAYVVTGYLSDRTRDKLKAIRFTLIFRVALYLILGLIMGFPPALWIVVVAAVINLLSDFAGQYENGLFTPLILRIISEEERQQAMAFSQTVRLSANIIFKAVSAGLVSFIAYNHLAFLNAGTFAVALLAMIFITPGVNRLLAERPLKIAEQPKQTEKGNFLKSLKDGMGELTKVPELRLSLVIVPALNALFSVITTLVVLMMKADRNFVFISPASTLASVSIALMLGNILGGIMVMNVMKDWTINRLLGLSTAGLILVMLTFMFHQPYLFMGTMLVAGILIGAINPKFSTLFLTVMPEEKLATLNGIVSTYFQLGTASMQFLVSGLILILSVDQLAILFLCLASFLGLYTSKQLFFSKMTATTNSLQTSKKSGQ